MLDPATLAEADRQFTLCNACRYCEGLCSVFPAMELRAAFEEGDVTHLAHLCHDCRACLHACPFAEPHEFAIDIPALMSRVRTETYERYARPRWLWRLLTRPRSNAALAAIGILFFALVAVATGDPSRVTRVHDERASFYHVIAYLWLVIPAGALSVAAAAVVLAGVLSFARETPGGARRLLSMRANAHAAADALGLRNLKGGGGGCHYPGDTVKQTRRRLHTLVFYGFALMFLATVSAAVEQELLGKLPPYPMLSVPVVLGTVGGLATLAGCVGFLVLGAQSRDARKSHEARQLDRIFTTTLMASTVTGLLTLGLRSTELMGPMLILHLGVLGGLYLTFPYGKFVHWVYRYVALVRSHVESVPRADAARAPGQPELRLSALLGADDLDA